MDKRMSGCLNWLVSAKEKKNDRGLFRGKEKVHIHPNKSQKRYVMLFRNSLTYKLIFRSVWLNRGGDEWFRRRFRVSEPDESRSWSSGRPLIAASQNTYSNFLLVKTFSLPVCTKERWRRQSPTQISSSWWLEIAALAQRFNHQSGSEDLLPSCIIACM